MIGILCVHDGTWSLRTCHYRDMNVNYTVTVRLTSKLCNVKLSMEEEKKTGMGSLTASQRIKC
jgi:hypothetical protein